MLEPHAPIDAPEADGLNLRFVTPEEIVGGLFLFAATVLASVQVISRTVIGDSFIWAEEAVVVMVVWAVFFGASAVTYRRLHIRMDILAVSVKSKFRPAIETVASLICVAYVVTVLYLAWQFMAFLRMSGETNPSMSIPQWLLYIGFPIGMTCMLVRASQDFLRHARVFLRDARSD